MKILIYITLVLVGLAGGVYFFLTNQKDESKVAEVVVAEKDEVEANLAQPNSPQELAVKKLGNFNKIDSLHYATGTVSVYEVGENYKIKFANNFASAEGPDLFVYLSASQDFKNRAVAGLDTSKTINLGVLKNIKGEQEYFVSKKDFESHDAAVVIWCKEFGIQFSRADLK